MAFPFLVNGTPVIQYSIVILILFQIPKFGNAGACKNSFYPLVVGNDKGDTKVFAFDINMAAPRIVVAGETSDKDLRTYDVANPTPMIV